MRVEFELPDAVVERIAQRAAELVTERQADTAAPWLNAENAAAYIDAPIGRVHDLVQLRKLTPHRDGRRLLFRRADLDGYLEGGGR